MPSDQPLSHAAGIVRRHDRDRFVTALFAPPEARERLMLLYAFNVEVALVKDSVRESMAGMIRLQWWREGLAGQRDAEIAGHPVAGPLVAACRTHKVDGAAFERLLEARERELTPEAPADVAALEAHAADTSATLTTLGLELLGVRDEATLAAGRAVGTAFALVGMLRSVPHQASAGRVLLPQDHVPPADLLAGRAAPQAVAAASRAVALRARHLLAEARQWRVDRRGIAALLPATLASGHLATLEKAGWNVFDSRVAQPKRMPLRLAFNVLRGRF